MGHSSGRAASTAPPATASKTPSTSSSLVRDRDGQHVASRQRASPAFSTRRDSFRPALGPSSHVSAHPGELDWGTESDDEESPVVHNANVPRYFSISLPSGEKRRYSNADCATIAAAKARGDNAVALAPATTSPTLRLEVHFKARGYEMMQLNLDTGNVREVIELYVRPPVKKLCRARSRAEAPTSSKAASGSMHVHGTAAGPQQRGNGAAAMSLASTPSSIGTTMSRVDFGKGSDDNGSSHGNGLTSRAGGQFGGDFGGGPFSGSVFAEVSFGETGSTVNSPCSTDVSTLDKDFAQLRPDQQVEITRARKLSYNALMEIAAKSAQAAPGGLPSSNFCSDMPPGLPTLYREAFVERFRQCYEQRRQ